MQSFQILDMWLENLQVLARMKCLIAALQRGCHCQQLSPHLLMLFGELGHAVIGPRWLVALGFGCFFHDTGVAVEPRELVGQRHELLVGRTDPNLMHVSHHAIDDGLRLDDTFDGELQHLLIYPRGQLAEFVYAHQFPASFWCRNARTYTASAVGSW